MRASRRARASSPTARSAACSRPCPAGRRSEPSATTRAHAGLPASPCAFATQVPETLRPRVLCRNARVTLADWSRLKLNVVPLVDVVVVGCIAELAPTGCRRTHTVARPRSTRDCGTRPPQSATRLPRSDLARAGRCRGASRCSSDRAVTPRRARRSGRDRPLLAAGLSRHRSADGLVDDRERDLAPGRPSRPASCRRAVPLRRRRRTRCFFALLDHLVVLGGQRCESQLETRLRPRPFCGQPQPARLRGLARRRDDLLHGFNRPMSVSASIAPTSFLVVSGGVDQPSKSMSAVRLATSSRGTAVGLGWGRACGHRSRDRLGHGLPVETMIVLPWWPISSGAPSSSDVGRVRLRRLDLQPAAAEDEAEGEALEPGGQPRREAELAAVVAQAAEPGDGGDEGAGQRGDVETVARVVLEVVQVDQRGLARSSRRRARGARPRRRRRPGYRPRARSPGP